LGGGRGGIEGLWGGAGAKVLWGNKYQLKTKKKRKREKRGEIGKNARPAKKQNGGVVRLGGSQNIKIWEMKKGKNRVGSIRRIHCFALGGGRGEQAKCCTAGKERNMTVGMKQVSREGKGRKSSY